MTHNYNGYYGATAYRSDQPKKQAEQTAIPGKLGFTRLPWGYSQGRLPRGMASGMRDFVLMEDEKIEALQPNIPPEKWQVYNHQYLRNTNYDTVSEMFNFIFGASRVAAIFTTIVFLFTFLMESCSPIGEQSFQEVTYDYLKFSLIIPGIFYYLWGIGKLVVKYWPQFLLMEGDGTVKWELNRQTGIVTNYETNCHNNPTDEPKSAPFYEFDGYIYTSMTRHGFLHEFMLYHRYEGWKLDISELTSYKVSQGMVINAWEFIQDYMDTSKPLPENPILEAYRHLDPVTAKYDRKTGRLQRKWRDLDEEQWNKWADQLEDSSNKLDHPCLFEQGGYVKYDDYFHWDPSKL